MVGGDDKAINGSVELVSIGKRAASVSAKIDTGADGYGV